MSGFLARLRGGAIRHVEPALPRGMRVYCVGDIHGRADLLEELHAMILADSEPYGGHKKVIYLGDYIDRGQYSKQVIELLLNQALEGFESIFLRGNHEQALLDFLEHPERAQAWLRSPVTRKKSR